MYGSETGRTTLASTSGRRPSQGLRVHFVATSDGVGGTESQASVLVRALKASGVEVSVTVIDGGQGGQDWGAVNVTRLLRSGEGMASRLHAVISLTRELVTGRVDVVHAAMAQAHTLVPLALALLPRRRRPLVVAWRRNMGAHSGRWVPDAIERIASRRCDVLIANSQAVRDYWMHRGHHPRQAFEVIPNALEDWRFDTVPPARLLLAQKHLVTVGNLREVKGHRDLIDAAALLRERHQDVGVVIVGEGELEAQLIEQARELRVPLLIVAGVRDTRPYLAAADVYVHPSHSEGASNAVAEALAQGCRVVATDTGNARELLEDASALVEPRRPVDLSEAVLGAMGRDPSGTPDAFQMLTTGHVVANHLKIYQEGVAHVRHRWGG